jgi:hypothetical protein
MAGFYERNKLGERIHLLVQWKSHELPSAGAHYIVNGRFMRKY